MKRLVLAILVLGWSTSATAEAGEWLVRVGGSMVAPKSNNHDVAEVDTPLECGMGFVCDLEKEIPFIGRDAILKQKESKSFMKKRLVQFLLKDPEAMLYHHEPILRDGKIVGHLTSGNYGHTLGGSVGLGYIEVEDAVTVEYLDAGKFEIDVGGDRVPAEASLSPMYDPRAERMRG